MSFLELRGVSKSHGAGPRRTEILHDLDLTVEEGEFVAVVGYSGSGKTTLINLVAGLTRPDYGEVLLDGRPITGPGPDRGVIFQNYSLLPWLTVSANIALAVDSCFPDWSAAKRRDHVAQHIEMVGLGPHAQKLPRQLSGGQRQRVAVARGLAMDPRILLLDEPLGALDALTRGSLQEEIARIWQATRKTVLLITNDVDEALLLADRVIPLTTGPSATLGDPVPVPLARPRDRKALNHDPEFKHLRALIMRQLLAFGARRTTTVSRKLILPDLLPEDLTRGRPLLALGARPHRRHEEKREEITFTT